MHPSNLVKQEFLAKWISDLKKCDSLATSMSVIERKNAIKLSADIAMAAVRRGATCWSRAILARYTTHKLLPRRILNKARYRPYNITNNIVRSRARFLTRSRIRMKQGYNMSKSSAKMRKVSLKSLVPGGDLMDDKCLIQETLDYIMYLRAQVEVMRTVAANSTAGRVAGNIASNDHRNNVVNK